MEVWRSQCDHVGRDGTLNDLGFRGRSLSYCFQESWGGSCGH